MCKQVLSFMEEKLLLPETLVFLFYFLTDAKISHTHFSNEANSSFSSAFCQTNVSRSVDFRRGIKTPLKVILRSAFELMKCDTFGMINWNSSRSTVKTLLPVTLSPTAKSPSSFSTGDNDSAQKRLCVLPNFCWAFSSHSIVTQDL